MRPWALPRLPLPRWIVLAVLAAVPSAAHAAPQAEPPAVEAPPAPEATPGEALATELFNAGRTLLEEGRAAEACPKLAESAKLAPRVGTLGNLADCEERLGRLARARAFWQQAANLAKSSADARQAHAEAQLARLDARVPKVRIVAPAALPPGLTVRLDDAEVGAGSFGTPMPLDPGAHTIAASAPGRTAWKVDLELFDRGETTEVAIPDLPLEAGAGPAPGAAARGSVAVPGGPSPLGVVGLVATGVGVVGLGAATYFAGVAQSRADLSDELGCEGDRCTAGAAEVRESARDAGTAATALFLGGGALAVGGLVTFLLAPDEVERVPVTAGRPRVTAGVAPPVGGGAPTAHARLWGAF